MFVFVMTLLLSAGAIFTGVYLNKTKFTNALVSEGSLYSQKDEGDIVLSVEKVGVFSTGDDYFAKANLDYETAQAYYANVGYPFKNVLYKESGKQNELNSLFVDNIRANVSDFPSYYYTDIQNGTQSKTVYHSGEYIMLNNSVRTKNVGGADYTYYYNPSITAYDDNGAQQEMAEAVLFSFGSYILGGGEVENLYSNTAKMKGSENYYTSNIQYLNVKATRNGSQIILPVVRQYGSNSYQDFSYIIPQRKGYDGHYEFVVEYRHNEEFKRQTFSFDLVFKSTYTEPESYENGSGVAYATMPTINMPISNQTYFNLGSSEQYPTLTYDFTKYTLDYTLTANGLTTNYSYRYVRQAGAVDSYNLVGTITGTNLNRTVTIPCDDKNKAVFVFTEVGEYHFMFDYIYNGEQNNMGFTINDAYMQIYGYELKYSKVGYSEAQMRYLSINEHQNDKVKLVVPNGYERENVPTDLRTLGVAYSINSVSGKGDNYRTGRIDTANTKDSLINNDKLNLKKDLNKTDIWDSDNDNKLNIDVDETMYQTTNQGGIWLSSNVKFVASKVNADGKITTFNSFYLTSKNPIVKGGDYIEPKPYTNATAFNETGYYLVLIKVDRGGANDFYQVFAFRYTNNTSAINVYARSVDEAGNEQYITPIGSGRFTNQNVKVSWVEPDVFERAITVSYYSIKNAYITKDEAQADNRTLYTMDGLRRAVQARQISSGQKLGLDINANEGASYLIEATNEGEAKLYRTFTIDKTGIDGVNMYAVSTGADNGTIYNVETDVNGEPIKLDAVTDYQATINWADKLSGAKITAKYYFSPIVKDNSHKVEMFNNTTDTVWFTNKYKLGDETGPFEIKKPENLFARIDSAHVLKNAGVYVFILTDEAGNECKFMFVFDNTEQYFRVKQADGSYYTEGEGLNAEQFFTQNNFVFKDKVSVEFATHKAVEMMESNVSNPNNAQQFISAFTKNDEQVLRNLNYYFGTGSNYKALEGLFAQDNSKYYLVVKNQIVTAYNQNNDTPNRNGWEIKKQSGQNPVYEVDSNNKMAGEENSTSFMRRVYVYAQNQYGFENKATKNDSRSYIWIEINLDNSLGKVYFNNTQNFDNESELSRPDNNLNLSTGNNILGAHATNDNYLAFFWTQGTGDYEIKEISYNLYSLNTSSYNADNYFYQNSSPETGVIFKKGDTANAVAGKTNRYYAILNVVDNKTKAGLYVVTRTYANNESQNYYFIVDRESVRDKSKEIGTSIGIELLEEGNIFNNFDQYGLTPNPLVYTENGVVKENITYRIMLNTNKLPAEIKVPVGKFFNGANASSYYAGRLNFSLYYFDRDGQLGKPNETQTPIKIFSTSDYKDYMNLGDAYYKDNKYLIVNLAEYVERGLISGRFITNEANTDWLYLPGVYVFVVEDSVENSTHTSNKYTIGFKINNLTPSTNVFAVASSDDNYENADSDAKPTYNTNNRTYTLVTNQEFIKIELPEYDDTKLEAQIDPNYLVINDSNGKFIYNYQHKNLGGENLPAFSDNKRTILLPTGIVRDVNGVIDLQNSAKHIEYTISVRFKIFNGNNLYYYKDCYKYYEAYTENNIALYRVVCYYEATYKVEIDREPPVNNTKALTANDGFVGRYNQANEVETMFIEAVHTDVTGKLYFANELNAYFNATSKDSAKLYAFIVNADTDFDNTGVSQVYYRHIDNLQSANLTLPITYFGNYNRAQNTATNITNYEQVFGVSAETGYYEVVEIDNAGNMSQYILLYKPEFNNISFDLKATYVKENAIKTNESLSVTNGTSSVTLFDFDAVTGVVSNIQDKFNLITVKNVNTGAEIVDIYTNAKTEFGSNLTAQVFNEIKSAGFGNYKLTVTSRLNGVSFATDINYVNQNDAQVGLNAQNLFVKNGNGWLINFGNAKYTNNGLTYYATTIEVYKNGTSIGVYTCDPADGYNYKNEKGEIVSVIDNLEGTYKIVLTDIFGKQSIGRLDTVTGETFHTIKFAGTDENANNYYMLGGKYYGFNSAILTYNKSLYNAILTYNFNGVDNVYTFTTNADGNIALAGSASQLVRDKYTVNDNYGRPMFKLTVGSVITVEILPYTEAGGSVVNAKFELKENTTTETEYYICIDTSTNAVNLKNADNQEHKLDFKYSEDYRTVNFTSTTSGDWNLMWTPKQSNCFKYEYLLHQSQKEGEDNKTINLEGRNNYLIHTNEDSSGSYWFEIRVYTLDGETYLGNAVYAFSVTATSVNLYRVVYTDDMAYDLTPNSSFVKADINTSDIVNGLKKGTGENLTLPITNMPLYVVNKDVEVIVSTDQGAEKLSVTVPLNKGGLQVGELTIYRVYTSTFSRYLGVMKILKPTDDTLATNVKVKYKEETQDISQFVTSIETDETVTLSFNQTNADVANLSRKNSIILNVYHNGVLLETKRMENAGKDVNYEIKGSGKYTFVISDLAGNKHNFTYGEETDEKITINVMKNIYFTLTNVVDEARLEVAPIDNAVFNGYVELTVTDPSIYDSVEQKPIQIEAYRNGVAYTPTQKGFRYTFSNYGNYKVNLKAKFNGNDITNSIGFTILNPNEARSSFDLTSISRYTITEVKNQNGDVITTEFLALINPQTSLGRLLTYETVLENADLLHIIAGKQKFFVTYKVEDGIYPTRQVGFAFTMNNEIPTIECSIELGKTTTKGFDITFNPGMIYEQVGDAYIYINDTIVCTIDENSGLEQKQYSIDQKTDGAGDYYVKLVGSSGAVITSFKVVVKEPLNVWAIIIIVVVSIIVIGVIVTIFVLRNKMRIR